MSIRFELVGKARTVLLKSWASRFGMLATLFGALAQFQDQLPMVQAFVPKNVFGWLTLACSIAVPLSRIVKQYELREATAAANPQPVTPAEAQ
jgi:ethanolamine utilization microcompartment shell protein EutS